MKENGNVQVDSDVALEIPPQTVIAYSLIELEVKKSGHYGECVCLCVYVDLAEFVCVLQICNATVCLCVLSALFTARYSWKV